MHVIVFLGGIPGAGKTTLGRQLQTTVPALLHLGASELLRAGLERAGAERGLVALPARESRDTSPGLVRPIAGDRAQAERFQEIIVEEFHRRRAAHEGPILLDGHFVVPTRGGHHPVSLEVFQQLGIARLARLDVSPDVAGLRLRGRGNDAPWWDGTVAGLERIQQAEAAHARHVALALGRALVEIPDRTPRELVHALLALPGARTHEARP
jgi:adenylate kinase